MRLKAIVLKNFRCFRDETRIDLADLTAFIGKNDVGKSSVLEALDIFFNEGIEPEDACVYGEHRNVTIGCVFSDFGHHVILDATAETKLRDEFLLKENGEFLTRSNSFKSLGLHYTKSILPIRADN